MHICSYLLCLVIVLWALSPLTEFALNEGKWQVGRKNPSVAKSPNQETAGGKTSAEAGISKNDKMMLHFRRRFEETRAAGHQRGGARGAPVRAYPV